MHKRAQAVWKQQIVVGEQFDEFAACARYGGIKVFRHWQPALVSENSHRRPMRPRIAVDYRFGRVG